MTIATPLLGLPKGEGSDNERDYLKGAIGGGGLWHALEVLDNAVMLSGSQTLSGKTLTGATLNSPVINTPTGDVVTPAGVATLTNKTLTSPVLTTPSFSGGITGNVGFGATPAAVGAPYQGIQIGQGFTLFAHTSVINSFIGTNTYYDGTNFRAIVTGAGVQINMTSAGGIVVAGAPSVAAGAVQTFTTVLSLGPTKPVVTGAKAGNAALTSLLTTLATLNLITDSTT